MKKGRAHELRRWFKLAALSPAAFSLAACGAALPSHHTAQARTHASTTSAAPMTLPSLVIDRGIPQALAIDLTPHHNELMLYRKVNSQWRTQRVMRTTFSKNFSADTLVCTSSGCFAAAAVSGGETDEIAVFGENNTAKSWKILWKTRVPSLAAGNSLQLAANGSDLWLLSTGSPGAGMMPKLLWCSSTHGRTWHLIATGDLTSPKAPFIMPQGYPTGIVAFNQGKAILSMSPRGSSSTVAVEYDINPLMQHPLPITLSPDQTPVEGLPAIFNTSMVSLPMITELQNAQRGYLGLAMQNKRLSTWSFHQIEPLSNYAPQAVSGADTEVLIDSHTIQIFKPSHHLATLPIRKDFISPLVLTVEKPGTIVVLGRQGTLWVNTSSNHWRHFN